MYDSNRWGLVFLIAPMKIPFEERVYLFKVAIEMYEKHERQRKVSRPMYSGVIETDGKYFCLGTFSGQRFTGTVETVKGEDRLSFLIAEHINAEMN